MPECFIAIKTPVAAGEILQLRKSIFLNVNICKFSFVCYFTSVAEYLSDFISGIFILLAQYANSGLEGVARTDIATTEK